ncbi:hypothetical protein Cni_G23081 [Canna indica]|uniref:Uncharacterized protein n=1 Tax=Canna indica TaxID=4628 RepID=A0AAQ3QIV7_9LILI|nr:hypothetical protein Cni_G23081 [Canna indica]
MGPVQSLTGVNDEGRPDIIVKSTITDLADTRDASKLHSANNGKGSMFYVESLSALTKVDEILEEEKLNMPVKSGHRELVGTKDASELMCANNNEDGVFHGGQSTVEKKVDDTMDEEIDIINCTDNSMINTENIDDLDATEYSSSFGDTSGSDSETNRDDADLEVDSPFNLSGWDTTNMDGFNKAFKKKKVTAHWRKFISPLTWRLQWLELRMKELLSQASKYDKKLAAYESEKQMQSKIIQSDPSISKLVPYTFQSHYRRAMKRRKRRRLEENVDISSYMPNHVIFSYYENKRTGADGHAVDYNCPLADDNTKGNDDTQCLPGSNLGDSSLEEIFLKIDAVQRRVIKLKSLLNGCICGDAKETSSRNLTMGDPPVSNALIVSSSRIVNGSHRNSEYAMPSGRLLGTPSHHVLENELEEDGVMSESEASSSADDGDVYISIPKRIQWLTMGMSLEQFQISVSENPDNVLIDNPTAQEVYCNFEKINCEPSQLPVAVTRKDERHSGEDNAADNTLIDNPLAQEVYWNFERISHASDELPAAVTPEDENHSGEEKNTTLAASMPEPDPVREDINLQQQAILKPCNRGRKRGRKPKTLQEGDLSSGPLRSSGLNGPDPSRSEGLTDFIPPRSRRLNGSSPLKHETVHRSAPWRSERLQKRRLSRA